MVYMEEDGSQHREDSPTLFEKRSQKVNVETLGQRRRVAQTEKKPFSLTTPGSDLRREWCVFFLICKMWYAGTQTH